MEQKSAELQEELVRQATESETATESLAWMKKKKIGAYFCHLVSEWSPASSKDGEVCSQWVEEVGARDVVKNRWRDMLPRG